MWQEMARFGMAVASSSAYAYDHYNRIGRPREPCVLGGGSDRQVEGALFVEESIGMTEDRWCTWRMYVHGVDRGRLKNATERSVGGYHHHHGHF